MCSTLNFPYKVSGISILPVSWTKTLTSSLILLFLSHATYNCNCLFSGFFLYVDVDIDIQTPSYILHSSPLVQYTNNPLKIFLQFFNWSPCFHYCLCPCGPLLTKELSQTKSTIRSKPSNGFHIPQNKSQSSSKAYITIQEIDFCCLCWYLHLCQDSRSCAWRTVGN